jgi:glycolate oxidase
MTAFLDELIRTLGPQMVSTDVGILDAHSHDQATWCTAGRAQALVRPRTTTDVQHALRVSRTHGMPVVTRGAGSGLSGGANAVEGCLLLSLATMNRVLDIDGRDGVAVVQPGVINADLKTEAADVGLWYPPDPASAAFSTIGGNVATNAGGLCCLKYGATRQWVRGLEAVLSDGRTIRTGGRPLASSAGYDLTGLLVGSEGTLGVITEVTLRLVPLPPPPATLVATFSTLSDAGIAVTNAAAAVVPSLLEIMDSTTISAVDDVAPMELESDSAALVIAQSEARTVEACADEISYIEKICLDAGATFTAATTDRTEGDLFLNARRLAYPALERRGATLLDDVAVPRSRLVDLISACQAIGRKHEIPIATFGHAGAGVLHPTIVFDRNDSEAKDAADAAFAEIIFAALDLGGTITGEHGVGRLKQGFLVHQLGSDVIELQRRIRALFDPAGLLNPSVGS